MAFEYPTSAGVLRLTKEGRAWTLRYHDKRRGRWGSPDVAADAIARHAIGLPEWDDCSDEVSPDIIDWRPLGGSI